MRMQTFHYLAKFSIDLDKFGLPSENDKTLFHFCGILNCKYDVKAMSAVSKRVLFFCGCITLKGLLQVCFVILY